MGLTGGLVNETVIYEIDIKNVQFESEIKVIKKYCLRGTANLTNVFKDQSGTKSGATVSDVYQSQLKKSISCRKNHRFSDVYSR